MNARLAGVGVVAVFALASGCVSSGAAFARAVGCSLAPGRTVEQVGRVRVLSRLGSVYACRVGSDRMTRLGRRRGDGRVAGLAVAGNYVGYWLAWYHKDAAVITFDTRNTHARKRGDCGALDAGDACLQLVLKPNGSVAWTKIDKYGTGSVWKSDSTAEQKEVDESFEPISGLALSGSTLYWTKQGAAHTATLN